MWLARFEITFSSLLSCVSAREVRKGLNMNDKTRLPLATVKRYAQLNVLTSFLVWGVALAGVSMMMPVMYGEISKEMGWSIGETTSFMVVKGGVSAIAGLFAGSLFSRYGLKQVFTIAVAFVGLSCALLYFANSLPVYYLLAGVSGFASILCAISFQVTLARWYSARLGRITGIAMLGAAAAGAIVPLATTYSLQHFGWQETAGIAGVGVLVLLTLLVSTCVHEDPEKYGYSAEELDPGKTKPAAGAQIAGDDFKTVVRSRSFIIMMIAVVASGAISNGINEHIPLFLSRQADLGQYMAALGFTIVLVISGAGKILFGWLFDRFSLKGVAICWIMCGAAVACAFPVTGFATFLVFTIVRGLSHGGVIVQTPIIARHMFGLKSIAQSIAFLNAAFQLGSASGIALIGWGYDLTGGYTAPFIFIMLISVGAAAIAYMAHPKYWSGHDAQTPNNLQNAPAE